MTDKKSKEPSKTPQQDPTKKPLRESWNDRGTFSEDERPRPAEDHFTRSHGNSSNTDKKK